MTLPMDVLRLITIKALRGRTEAGMRVLDSPAEPADIRFEEDRAPYIAVYTDDADIDLDESLVSGDFTAFLVLEVSVADRVEYTRVQEDQDPSDPDYDAPPGTVLVTEIASTTEALELQIGIISRQALAALVATDNPWADLWKRMVLRRKTMNVRRGGSGQTEKQDGPRYAARVMRISLEIANEPVWGDHEAIEPGTFWGDFLALADQDDELATVADIIRAQIEAPAPLASWRVDQQKMTWADDAARSVGISPAVGTEPVTPEDRPWPLKEADTADEHGNARRHVGPGPLPEEDSWHQ